jgi:hypothetical protein
LFPGTPLSICDPTDDGEDEEEEKKKEEETCAGRLVPEFCVAK